MARGTPMQITLYGPDDEIKATFTRSFVPWKLLKVAIRLMKTIDLENLSEDDVDAIASLVVETFGDKFTLEELNNGADIPEMVAVLQTIISKASGGLNPTLPPGK